VVFFQDENPPHVHIMVPRRFLMATPDRIAPALLAACSKARGLVYLPWYWRPIMIVIRVIPEALFRRLRFGAPAGAVQ
jgi:hypothetical protein